MLAESYKNQVELLVEVLSHVAKEDSFALKGGTAINLFYNDLPRLSVDIDVAYIDFDTRNDAYKNINSSSEGRARKL